MAIIGYARVSTDEQSTAAQADELKAAGCSRVFEEHGSGASRDRPVLNQLLRDLAPGDTLMIVRFDRLARSLSHLLAVVEDLNARDVQFRSLRDPVDTSSPQGKFALQVLGAAAELERSLIRDRTQAGLERARSEGRVGGNPGLRAKDPAAMRKLLRARDEAHFDKLETTASDWVPEVRRLRPAMPWQDVVRLVNAGLPSWKKSWTVDRLKRAAKRYVDEGLLEADVLKRSPTRPVDDRLLAIVVAIAHRPAGHDLAANR